jgi:hypothetical protein
MPANAIEIKDNIALPAAAVDGPVVEAFDTRSSCFLTWPIETMDKTETVVAAAAVYIVVVEVFDNIQNLCRLTAPYPELTWLSRRD